MQFQRIEPPIELKKVVECYWIAHDTSPSITSQKIIPDGFPELIFHFGKPYRINLSGNWETQTHQLLAGQITKFFFLENTGASDILGIKLRPTAPKILFNIDMSKLKDRVVDISTIKNESLNSLDQDIKACSNHQQRIDILNKQLLNLYTAHFDPRIEQAVDLILKSNGTSSIASICDSCQISERQLERLFKSYVGLSPKFFTRVIRFSYIFQVVQRKKISWTEVGLESGYYDQAHFIKNFKTFVGEDPSKYFFDKPTMANFFLKKK